MNKSTMIAAIFAASTLAASAADVYSSNIVGYSKLPLSTGYNMFSAQFQEVGTESIDLQDLFSAGTLPDPVLDGENVVWGAKLLAWTGIGYDIYYWSGATGLDLFGDANWDNKWLLNEGESVATGVAVLPGDGMFLQVNAASSATVAGEVVNSNSVDLALSAGYNLVGNPYPVSIDIQGLTTTNFPDPVLDGETVVWGAQLLTWTGIGYNIYYWSGATGLELFGDAAWDNKWLTNEGEAIASGVSLDVGDGAFVWLKTGTTGAKITFSK